MKILIVDNGTSYLPQLITLLGDNIFHVVKYSEISFVIDNDFDAIVLSGGHDFSVSGNEDMFRKEMDFVKNSNKPIFGICLGFEIIASAFGAKLELMEKKERGILDIQITKPDEIFVNIPNFQVFESHRWVIKDPVDEFIVLACSKDGIEAIKHKTKSIYAVQFHPEMFVEKTCGNEIFHNFLYSIK
jgi:GMP synthase-like glutamine amidotransferase